MLVVDDEESNLQYLKLLFESRNYSVETARDGKEALEAARNDPPDIVISDILMPVMDGFKLCREWKNDNRLKKIPFVFLTGAFTNEKDKKLAENLNADLFIMKPKMPDELLGLIGDVLARFESQQTVTEPKSKDTAEKDILEQYGEVLSRKLEDKIRELEEANRKIYESEKNYRSVFENAIEGLYRTTRQGQVLMANPTLCHMLGYDSLNDLLAHVTDLSQQVYENPQDRQRLLEKLEQKKTVKGFETRLRKKDGQVIWVRLSLRSIFDDNNDFLFYDGAIEDITDRKLASDALNNERQRFLTLADNAPFGLLLIDENGNFTYMNQMFKELFGYDLQEIPYGKEWFKKAYPDPNYRQNVIYSWVDDENRAGYGIKRPRAFTVKCKDGTNKIINFIPVKLTTGETIMSCEDITERRRIEDAIEKGRTVLRSLIDATRETLAMIDRAGKIYVANITLAQRLGTNVNELIGTSLYDYFPPDISASRKKAFDSVFDTGIPAHFTDERNGKIYEIDAYPTENDKGQIENIVIFASDVTVRMKAESALAASEKKYRNIFENASEGIFQTTPDGRILSANPAFARMAGYASPEEMIKMVNNAGEELYARQEDKKKFVRGLKEKGRLKDFVVLHCKKGGGTFWGSVNAQSVNDADGNILYYEGTLEDITERRLAEERLRDALSQLGEKNTELQKAYEELKTSHEKTIQSEKMASIGQLAAGVAHEINNPTGFVISNLNSLRKYVERLREFYKIQETALEELTGADENQREIILDSIKANKRSLKIDFILEDVVNLIQESLDGADRVKNIVQDLKSFSRVDDAAYTMNDIHAIMETTLNIVWNELKYKATLSKDYGDIPPTKCNPGQLSQVFMNILVNAAQAIREYGEIKIRTWHDDQNIFVSISDTGPGIPVENMKKLFDPFYTTKEVGKGTGLGLSISYDIVKKHNGEILVASEPDKGTTMTVKIPIQEVDNESGNNDITGRR